MTTPAAHDVSDVYGPWYQFRDALDAFNNATENIVTNPDFIFIDLTRLTPVVTGTLPTIGDIPYRSLPGATDTLINIQFQQPQGWDSYTASMLLAKNFNSEGTVDLVASSGSDPSNQLAIGDSPATASPKIFTTWTVPVGSTTAIQHQIVEVPVADVQLFEADPIICNLVVGRLGVTGTPPETFGGGTPRAVALFGVMLRRSSP